MRDSMKYTANDKPGKMLKQSQANIKPLLFFESVSKASWDA